MSWIKARSWHVYAFTYRGGTHRTRCGRTLPADAPTSPSLPLEEKSCETCTRLVLHDEEAPA